MKYLLIIPLLLSSCAQMPSLLQSIDDIETSGAICVQVDKNAIQKETDVRIQVNVENKDQPKTKE